MECRPCQCTFINTCILTDDGRDRPQLELLTEAKGSQKTCNLTWLCPHEDQAATAEQVQHVDPHGGGGISSSRGMLHLGGQATAETRLPQTGHVGGEALVQEVLIPPQGRHWPRSPCAHCLKLVASRP